MLNISSTIRRIAVTALIVLLPSLSSAQQSVRITNGNDAATGSTSDSAYSGSGSGTAISILKAINAKGISSTFGATFPTYGSAVGIADQGGSGNMISVPGDATSGIWVNVKDGGLAQGAATAGQKGSLVMGAATTAAPTYATGNSYALSLNLIGQLRTETTIRPTSQIASAGVISGTSAISATAIAAQGTGNRIYMTDYSCGNSGATAVVAYFLNGNSVGATPIWHQLLPAGGGGNKTFATPVSTTANTALILSTSAASSTVTCSVSGYSGS